ncbi:MAG: bifunctional metallophosphatase/5'-nucleotidase [Burkholderiales bacterium]|nr:bifunctional metallophosphatase/5'-nucleotidase [Burkholderiales bacterium]
MHRLPALLFVLLCTSLSAISYAADSVRVRVLAINDFHGQLEPAAEAAGSPGAASLGGAAWLAAHVRRLAAASPHHVFVSAGDLINASPFISALFQDEPTIEAMDTMGLALNGVGNHEFDEGVDELLRMQRGGCHPAFGCRFRPRFDGARLRFLAANVVRRSDGETLFPAYEILQFGPVRIAFIGVTLQATAGLVNAQRIAGWRFDSPWRSINALVPRLRTQAVEAIVVLLHEGGYAGGGANDCPSLSGPVRAVVEKMDPAVDAVLTGHTHQSYVCRVQGRPVTSAGSAGWLVTRLDLEIDVRTGHVLAAHAHNEAVTHDIEPDPVVAAIVQDAVRVADRHDRVVGTLAGDIGRRGAFPADVARGGTGESALGNLVADAQLWATREAGAQIALTNPGGLRADLLRSPDGRLLFSDLFAAQPFSNHLVTLTLSGAQLRELLEQQFARARTPRVLQVSRGLSYTWRSSAARGQRVHDLRLSGRAISPGSTYRVTVNDYLLGGGERFGVLDAGGARTVGPLDVEALEAYARAHAPLRAPAPGRIRRID